MDQLAADENRVIYNCRCYLVTHLLASLVAGWILVSLRSSTNPRIDGPVLLFLTESA